MAAKLPKSPQAMEYLTGQDKAQWLMESLLEFFGGVVGPLTSGMRVSASKFQKLADAQRDLPESAMLRLQHSQISQLYGYAAEHTGDLTHRMAQQPDFFRGSFGNTQEKVRKVLRSLRHPYGFDKEVREQIGHNLNYYQKQGKKLDRDAIDEMIELKALGHKYAQEHRKLPVYNQAQFHAREAAVSLGEFKTKKAIEHLEVLESQLAKGRESWESFALENLD